MMLEHFIAELKRKKTVPFLMPMSEDELPDFPEGFILPISEEVYFYYLEMLPPRWMSRSCFCYAEGYDRFRLFWQDRDGFYGLQLSAEDTARFSLLSGAPVSS